jgi:hypothetical protein
MRIVLCLLISAVGCTQISNTQNTLQKIACSNEIDSTIKAKCGISDCTFSYQGLDIFAGDGRVVSISSPNNAYFKSLFNLNDITNLEAIASDIRKIPAYSNRVEFYARDDEFTQLPDMIEIDDFVSCHPKSLSYYLHISANDKDEIIFSMDTDPAF